MKVLLTKPLDANGEAITELTLREPIARDYRGQELVVEAHSGRLIVSYDAILQFASKLSGHLPYVLDQMAPKDVQEVAGAVLPFLLGGLDTGSSS
ncbi:MAG TPA: phage tail assembly protein [Candidatus Defluviicoccus seviourii]|nr:phage tail assembly protein [Candidatus Defluviicoccus seviourii]HRW61246.1 phage tail assembly protein [Defluviicoccus sp.]